MNIKNNESTMPPYNSQQEALLMPEYGRMVQRMVENAIQITDRAERQRYASYIVTVMSRAHKAEADRPGFAHKVWNNLARISRYQLDVDYPVDIVTEEECQVHPEPLSYPRTRIKHRHYGSLTEQMLAYLAEHPHSEDADHLSRLTINQMYQSLFTWNRDSLDEAIVRQDFMSYTKGRLPWPDHFEFATPVKDEQETKGRKRKKKK